MLLSIYQHACTPPHTKAYLLSSQFASWQLYHLTARYSRHACRHNAPRRLEKVTPKHRQSFTDNNMLQSIYQHVCTPPHIKTHLLSSHLAN